MVSYLDSKKDLFTFSLAVSSVRRGVLQTFASAVQEDRV